MYHSKTRLSKTNYHGFLSSFGKFNSLMKIGSIKILKHIFIPLNFQMLAGNIIIEKIKQLLDREIESQYLVYLYKQRHI